MNPDTTDIILIFAFILLVLVLAFASAMLSAYRQGWTNGKAHGVLIERERVRGLEGRVSQAIEKTFEGEGWEREMDV